ncbi:MAG: oxidoreductase, partial [Phototrophicales bacterium]
MDTGWHRAEIVGIIDEAPKIKRFRIKLIDEEVFHFRPGQFVALELPIHEDPKKRLRYYSIASNPDGSNEFELVIVLKDDGLGTSFLFFKCDVG